MGLLPVQLLRARKESFVELNAYDISGKSSYGTAGYLGNGYFVTVKHAVVALDDAGGGVLDQDGDLVGIPIGRMQGDYRFSFILPLRAEMFRKVPGLQRSETKLARATD